jgi:RsiW-degrading membrane proteinase PrsW (M82 family)
VRPAHRLVLLLLTLQVVATGFMWTLSATERGAQATFATFLGTDLLAFAVVSYIYRTEKSGERPNRALLVAGCSALAVLLLSSLFTA